MKQIYNLEFSQLPTREVIRLLRESGSLMEEAMARCLECSSAMANFFHTQLSPQANSSDEREAA